MRTTWWLGAAVLALVGLAGKAQAVQSSTATLVIDVTVTGSLSVNINSAASSTQTVVFSGTPNELLVSPSTVAVQNNSGVLSERWEINSANGFDNGGGGDAWTLNSVSTSAVGADQFAIQAVFGSSNTVAGGCPAGASAEWNNSVTTPPLQAGVTNALPYTSTQFADATLNNNGSYQPDVLGTGYMFANSSRALCWRIVGPASVTLAHNQIVNLEITAF